MGVELRPMGVSCNISCRYCYQHSQRSVEKNSCYSLDKMKEALDKSGEAFTLFGGEPLLMPFEDLEYIFSWGLEKFGKNSIQTNGTLIEDRHIRLFKRYKVDIGISIDGPGELNAMRWCGSIERTMESTVKVEAVIERLCGQGLVPGLIVTFHRLNASEERLPVMCQWIRRLDGLGIKSVRLHLMEVDSREVGKKYALTEGENINALLSLISLGKRLKNIRFDIAAELRALLLGKDESVSCVWRACDPFTTPSVKGIEGSGSLSKCGRVNKEGIEYLKPHSISFERYIYLYSTSQEQGGCKDCRFFLMCKGQCPGTAEDGDWRDRTEHCGVWRHLLNYVERELVLEGHTPISLHPCLDVLEKNMVEAWKSGSNPPISGLSWKLKAQKTCEPPYFNRRIWISEESRREWEPRLLRLREAVAVFRPEIAEFMSQNSGESLKTLYLPVILGLPAFRETSREDGDRSLVEKEEYNLQKEWLEEILSWPWEISFKNGLGEIKTPVLKIITNHREILK